MVVGSRCWGLLRGASTADLVFSLLGVFFFPSPFRCKCFLCFDFIPFAGGGGFLEIVAISLVTSAGGLDMVVAAGRAESLLSSVLNS